MEITKQGRLQNVANVKFHLYRYRAINVVKIFILHLKDYNKGKFFINKGQIYNVNHATTNTGITIGIIKLIKIFSNNCK